MIRIIRRISCSAANSSIVLVSNGMLKSRQISLVWSRPPHYNFGFFKSISRSKQYAITQQIKSTTTSEQLLAIIRRKGQCMNIVNLTAVLDRMEEQQMINTKEIIQFVIAKLKMQEYIFRELPMNCVRALCNIICYLGNVRNRELNQYFMMVDYTQVMLNCNKIEKVMLINGLVRLKLFPKVFSLQPDGKSNNIVFTLKLLQGLNINQVLSIWHALNQQESLKSSEYIQIVETFLNANNFQIKKLQQINLKTYTYALTCFLEIQKRNKHNKDTINRNLYSIVKYNLPSNSNKANLLMPHQLSLLLKAIHKVNKLTSSQKTQSIFIYITDEFKKLVNKNVQHICKKKNITLRNLANVYKELHPIFELESETAVYVIETFNSILEDEIAFRRRSQDYEGYYKVDLLSLCCLSWKVNELHIQKNFLHKETLCNIMKNIQIYILEFVPLKRLQKISINELLMLYSGFYDYCRNYEMSFNPQFEQLTSSLMKKPSLNFNIKELTIIYNYLRHMKFGNPQLCRFLIGNINRLYHNSLKDNINAELILNKNGCIMDLGQKCKNCFQKPSKNN